MPSRSLCSLAPALENSLHSKTNFEINLHLINILHGLWSVVCQPWRERRRRDCLDATFWGSQQMTGC